MTHLLHRDLSLHLFWFLPGTLTQGLIQLCFIQQHGQALAVAEKRRPEVLAQIAEIKRFYGLREQCLETLIQGDAASAGPG